MSYHITHITKGTLGELSKIQEELFEAIDAENQNCDIMVLLELSDMIGAVESYLQKHHPTISVDSLKKMSDITKRAFASGHRT